MISYKYKLYNSKKNKKIHDLCRSSAFVWNHCLALQQRYYKLYKKFINVNKLQTHFAKKVVPKHDFLKVMGSQSIQEIIQRLDASYQRFFKKTQKRPPKFKSGFQFSSFIFKQGVGYSLDGNEIHINKLKTKYKFFKSRDFGSPKTLRFKRDKLGDFYLIITSKEDTRNKTYRKTHDGASVGMDFGLKTYLTLSDGNKIESPQFFKSDLRKIKKLHSKLSTKKRVSTGKLKYSKKKKHMVPITKLSNNGERSRKDLVRAYRKITNRRTNWQYELAHHLCRNYDFIFAEDLNLDGMKRLWGRKVSDLCHASFIGILKEVSLKYGVVFDQVDRWFASSKTCSECGNKADKLELSDRIYVCDHCGTVIDRDLNAAINIERQGIDVYRSKCKTIDSSLATCDDHRIPRF